MNLKDAVLQKLESASDDVLQDILALLDARTQPREQATKRSWSPNFFAATAGRWAGEPLVRAPQETQPERELFS